MLRQLISKLIMSTEFFSIEHPLVLLFCFMLTLSQYIAEQK